MAVSYMLVWASLQASPGCWKWSFLWVTRLKKRTTPLRHTCQAHNQISCGKATVQQTRAPIDEETLEREQWPRSNIPEPSTDDDDNVMSVKVQYSS
eukprot:5772078-Amphidinium_carterae.2